MTFTVTSFQLVTSPLLLLPPVACFFSCSPTLSTTGLLPATKTLLEHCQFLVCSHSSFPCRTVFKSVAPDTVLLHCTWTATRWPAERVTMVHRPPHFKVVLGVVERIQPSCAFVAVQFHTACAWRGFPHTYSIIMTGGKSRFWTFLFT
jgi:hypothetical protein